MVMRKRLAKLIDDWFREFDVSIFFQLGEGDLYSIGPCLQYYLAKSGRVLADESYFGGFFTIDFEENNNFLSLEKHIFNNDLNT